MHEPIATSLPEVLTTQPPVVDPGCSSASLPVRRSSSVLVFKQIDELLQKVDVLSKTAPTTCDRLGNLAGIFPPGHGPSNDVVKQATDNEVSCMDNLSSALSFIRKGFADLGRNQDLLCMGYEKEAALIEEQIRKDDYIPSGVRVEEPSAPVVNEHVLGQSADEAEVHFSI